MRVFSESGLCVCVALVFCECMMFACYNCECSASMFYAYVVRLSCNCVLR